MVSTEQGIDRISEGIQTFLKGKHKKQVREVEAQLQVSIFSILSSRNFPFGHITGFMNCVIDFICKADLPVCYIFLFDHSFLKKKKEQTKTNRKEKKSQTSKPFFYE